MEDLCLMMMFGFFFYQRYNTKLVNVNKKPNFMVKRGKQIMHSKWNVKEGYPEFDIFEKTNFFLICLFLGKSGFLYLLPRIESSAFSVFCFVFLVLYR